MLYIIYYILYIIYYIIYYILYIIYFIVYSIYCLLYIILYYIYISQKNRLENLTTQWFGVQGDARGFPVYLNPT